MENKNKISLIVLIVLTIAVVGVCVYSIINKKDLEESDAVKFRNEYMELNDKVNNNGQNYLNVTISETNTIKYISAKKAVELLQEGTGVIYFGFATCPWCRSLIPILTKIAEEKKETIYYLDVLELRSTFQVEEGKLIKTKNGTDEYYELLDILDYYLQPFVLEDDSGNKYDSGEKRLYAPSVVSFKDGGITDFHDGTVESQLSGYDKLTSEQSKELEEIITKLIESKNIEVCTKDKC